MLVAVDYFVLGGAVVAFGAASVMDLLRRRIPNNLVLGILVLAILRIATHRGVADGVFDVVDATIVLLIAMGMWLRHWLGAGDAKLIFAAALLVGAPALLDFLALTAFIGGALGAVALADQWLDRHYGLSVGFAFPLSGTAHGAAGALSREVSVPYGLAISLACFATLLTTTFAGVM